MSFQFLRGTTAKIAAYIGLIGEVTVDTDKKTLVVHDGVTPGGSAMVPEKHLAGAVVFFAMSSTPPGWLRANGAAVSRTAYAALFSAIGTTFGAGDGATTFNLPDLRGEFARGWDDARGVDAARALGSAQSDGFKSHTHTVVATVTGAAMTPTSGAYNCLSAAGQEAYATGGTETRPRNIALLACVKY